MDALGLTPGDIDWVVPHQANMRILQGTAKKLGLAPEKVVVTVDRHANTSAASVPLALDEAVRDGRVKQVDLVVLEAMGGDRKSVVLGKSVSVRVDLGGRRIIQKKKNITTFRLTNK